MTRRQILILTAILGILAAALLARNFSNRMDFARSRELYGRFSSPFDPSTAGKILIGKGTEPELIELYKEKDLWHVKNLWGAWADEARVDALLVVLGDLRGDLRSSEEEAFGDFGITDEESFSVLVTDALSRPLLDLKIGTRQPGHSSFFIRQAGRGDIFYTDAKLDHLLGLFMGLEESVPVPDFWADLSLFRLDAAQVRKITVKRLKDGVTSLVAGVEREPTDEPGSGRWKLKGPKEALPADPDKILRFIATLNSIRAQGVADPNGKRYGLESPVWELSVTSGEKETVLFAGAKDAKDYLFFVKKEGTPQVFRLNGHYFEDLNVTNDKFVKETAEDKAVIP